MKAKAEQKAGEDTREKRGEVWLYIRGLIPLKRYLKETKVYRDEK